MDEVKVMIMQILEKFNMLELMNKLPSPTERMLNTPREDILIAGGCESVTKLHKCVEIYSWEKNGWFEVSQMNKKHSGASSFIYNYQVFVVGGAGCKAIGTLNLNELPLKWMKYPGKLPSSCLYHQIVVYQQRVIHIGGYEGLNSFDVISELQLTSPVTMKSCAKYLSHGNLTVLRFLKIKSQFWEERIRGVSLPKKNECKKMPPLPHPLTQMATVC